MNPTKEDLTTTPKRTGDQVLGLGPIVRLEVIQKTSQRRPPSKHIGTDYNRACARKALLAKGKVF